MSEKRTLQGFFTALLSDQAINRMVEIGVGAVIGGPLGAVATPLLGKALEYYGVPMAGNLVRWVRDQPGPQACAALEAVANLSPAEALALAEAAVEHAAPPNTPPERLRDIKNYLASIPAAFRQSLPRAENGKSTCPAALLPQSERQALALLPTYLPPYNAPCELPATPYRLVRLLGTGGFGAVYEAVSKYEHEPRAIKFCLDPDRTGVLKRERAGFARLMEQAKAGGWPAGVVRYHGADLEHATPFLIFELAPDGDLVQYVQTRRARTGRAMTPDEVLLLIRELATAAGQLHAAGLTHRDLKPSNVLFSGSTMRIADLGLGAVVPQAGVVTRMRSVSDTTQESRGGGTALYMAPEQGRGAEPLPAQDVYSLGVIWYQLLTEDFGRAPGPTWRKAMSGRGVPEAHLGLLEACLDDDPRERPADGTALLAGIAGLSAEAQERRRQQALQTTREQEARQREAAEAEDRDREARERQERWHRYASARLWSACAWAAVCGLGGGLVGGILGHIGCVPFATALGGGLAGGIILPLLLFALAMASYSASGDTSTDDGALAGAAIWGVILGAVTGLILGFATIARDAKAWESSRFLAAGIIGGCLIGIAAGVYEGLRRANKSRPEGF